MSALPGVSETFDPEAWEVVPGFDFTDITYHRAKSTGAVRIAFDRPEIRNAFRPHTVDELYRALDRIRNQYGDRSVVTAAGMEARTIGRPNPFNGEAPLLLANRHQ